MNHMASLGFLSLEELLVLGFYNPLGLLGLDPAQFPPSEVSLYYDESSRLFRIG
jgi:hypothetical protein